MPALRLRQEVLEFQANVGYVIRVSYLTKKYFLKSDFVVDTGSRISGWPQASYEARDDLELLILLLFAELWDYRYVAVTRRLAFLKTKL